MSAALFSVFLNGVIIVLLGATIFYATRLSMHLKAFREGRKELNKLISELGLQIDKANMAIAGMNAAAKDAGRTLQDKINDARGLSDELQLMTQSADKLAGRMERSVATPKQAARADDGRKKRAARETAREPAKAPVEQPERGPSFSIRDSEFGREDMDQGLDEAALAGGGTLHSRAERELYEALRKRKPGGHSGGDRS